MIRNPLFVLMLLVATAMGTGCHPKSLPVTTTAPDTPEHPSNPIDLKETEAEATIVAGMVQTPCFGSCPAYEALVYSTGKVTWRGDRNVAMIGHYETRVNEQWIAELMAMAEQYGVFGMKFHYPADGHILDDVPHTLVLLRKGKETIRIDNQADAPLDLQRFEKHFLEKLISCQWTVASD